MLVACATVATMENLGIDYEIIRYKKKYTPSFALKSVPRLLNPLMISEKRLQVQKLWHKKTNPKFEKNSQIKDEAFYAFQKQRFTRLSPVYYGYDQLVEGAEKYSAIVVGSDQLWSPSGLPTNFYNLMFVPDHIPKVAYASSFGVSQIPFFQTARTRHFLQRLDSISMRENSGQAIVKKLTGREVPVVVDPTLLLDVWQWEEVITRHRPVEEPYLFAYFLGPNPDHRKQAQKLAAHTGLKLVAMRHMDQFAAADEAFGDEAPFDVGPEKFLNFIRHAEYVCTDSFHGTVFSVLHHKQFITFDRYSQNSAIAATTSRNSRIESLCENLALTKRRFRGSIVEEMMEPICYDQVDQRVATRRQESYDYLKAALSCLDESR